MLSLFHGLAFAVALVPVPEPNLPRNLSGVEENRGQANPEFLFISRGSPGIAVAPQSIELSPLGVRLSLVASNPNPTVRYLDPLPGVVNSFTGADASKWLTGIRRYRMAELVDVYPGVVARFTSSADGVTLRFTFDAGVDPSVAVMDIPAAVNVELNTTNGALVARLGASRVDPLLVYARPISSQGVPFGRVKQADFRLVSRTQFGFAVQERDPSLPLVIEMTLRTEGVETRLQRYVTDASGNTYIAATVPDAPGRDKRYTTTRWSGCGESIAVPIACTDVVVYAFSKTGELLYASYLAGRTSEDVTFFRQAPDGSLMLTGDTDSSDFPVTASALQPRYAGPEASLRSSTSQQVAGDFTAVKLDPATGAIQAATYFGGPEEDSIGESRLGADGSLHFIPKWLGKTSARMPVSAGARQGSCPGTPCTNAYAAHLTPGLDRLLYGTYLPGVTHWSELHSDGSVYYAGTAPEGFPTTAGAYQPRSAGGYDAIVARLDPQGRTLLFGTYIGGADTDWILRMAVAPDGSAWVSVSSFVQCCVDIRYRLVRLDARGEKALVDKPLSVGDMTVDAQGNLLATAEGPFQISDDAFVGNACNSFYLGYVKLSPAGEQLFASYLPGDTSTDFDRSLDPAHPLLSIGGKRYEVAEGQSMGAFAGCIVDAAEFSSSNVPSPGQIITIFGSGLGPKEGAAFELVDGRVPSTVGGTRVLVNGEPAPVLFASRWQVNAILPFSLVIGSPAQVQISRDGAAGFQFVTPTTQRASMSLFMLDGSAARPAAALNEDWTVNSPGNPAKKGSRLVLYGTGGGAVIPALTAGEVTPLEPRPLAVPARVRIAGGDFLTVEYSGAAPALVAGVNQINVKLPDEVPVVNGFPPGILPLVVETAGSSNSPQYVTIAIKP